MSVSFRSNASLSVFALALALAAFSPTGAMAQNAVENYADQIPAEGIMPQGVTWNKPLKAGDMVLPRAVKPKPKTTVPLPVTQANQPIGGLKAPQLGVTKDAKAPQITKDKANSTQGMMLMQGMKSALHQGGQNPDIPKSDLVPADLSAEALAKAEAAEAKEATKNALPAFGETPKAAEKTLASAAAVPLKSNEPGFVAGQEPKGWVSPDKAADGPIVKPVGDDGTMEIVFPPEMSQEGKSDAAAPTETPTNDLSKATIEMPKASEPAKAKEDNKPGLIDRMTKPFTSIFGDPVDEPKSETKAEPVPPADRAPAPTFAPMKAQASGDKCEPSVTKWMRECADAGYPSHFVGEIIGETRIECPSGDAKDVWLSNSCAAPVGNSSFNDADTRATNLAEAPSSLRKLAAASNEDLTSSVDGACGPANGLAATDAPSDDLCAQGMSTNVSGEGPWRWSCKGRRGGMTVSCAAPVATGKDALKKQKRASNGDSAASQGAVTEDGKCGEAHNTGTDSAPSGALCVKGVPSRVNGSGPWTWACSGTNGGMAAACTAPKKVDGACGDATDKGAESMPMQGLCTQGYASAVTGSGPWNWTCSGLHGGSAATCTAAAKINAVCGPAALRGHDKTPNEGLCNVGKPTEVAGNGPWNWTCTGDLGGASVSCNAKVSEDGACGAAHGNQFVKAPTQALCTSGTASRVSGVGPWNWNCGGTNGGETVSCTASLGSKESVAAAVGCGEAAEGLALGRPSDKLCASGATASDVTGDGPWKWTCSDNAGHLTSCSTLTASDGTCGKAANTTTREAPVRNLCASGASTEVVAFEKKSWRWECEGALGGKSTTCFAPMKGGEPMPATTPLAAPRDEKPQAPAAPEVKCGAANGMSYADKPPMTDLCESGKASAIKGTGPWTWTCASKKAKANCEAQRTVDGACGAANGSIQRTAPTTGLCSIGTATEVSGEGPWMWSCVGSGNGTSTSCSANAQSSTKVDGACGAATNTIMTSAPHANLCDSGMPSDVHGEGPWTWTCSGVNGGIASTCGTAKVMPQAPPPPGPMVNGVCGSANGQMSSSTPTYGLCSSGTPTAMSGEGPWNWGCIGANGGMTVSCTAPLTPPAPIVGVCGSANGVPTLVIPRSGLCAAGITSAVNGSGPWTWSCSGTNGGGAVSCVAPLAGGSRTSSQGQPSLTTPSLDGDAPAPRAAPAGLVTPTLPSGPLPAIKAPAPSTKKSGSNIEIPPLPAEALTQPGLPPAPAAAPSVPVSMKPVNPPAGSKKDRAKADATKAAPVSSPDSLPGARLVLDSDVSTISFSRGSDQMDRDAIEIVEKLSRILMANPMARITLVAYSDTGGSVTPRDARRISLNRALAVRDFMATKGVSSGRVDVRPMGANVPSGDMDRVDVKVN